MHKPLSIRRYFSRELPANNDFGYDVTAAIGARPVIL